MYLSTLQVGNNLIVGWYDSDVEHIDSFCGTNSLSFGKTRLRVNWPWKGWSDTAIIRKGKCLNLPKSLRSKEPNPRFIMGGSHRNSFYIVSGLIVKQVLRHWLNEPFQKRQKTHTSQSSLLLNISGPWTRDNFERRMAARNLHSCTKPS